LDDEPIDFDSAAAAPEPDLGLGLRFRRRRQARQARWLAAGAAGLAAAFSGAEPTGTALFDPVMTGVAMAVLAFACGTSKRWTWLVLAGVATGMASSWAWAAVGAVALAISATAAIRGFRSPLLGTLVGAIAIQPLLHLTDLDRFGVSALAASVAAGCVLVSVYRHARRHSRRLVRRAVIAGGAFVFVAALGAGVSIVDGRTAAERGLTLSEDGLDSLRSGDQAAAIEQLEESETAFAAAGEALSSPFALPSRLVPVLAQHTSAMADLAQVGTEVTGVAAATASAADYQGLRLAGGQIDLAAVASMEEPLQQAEQAQVDAIDAVDAAVSPWVVAPIAQRAEDLAADLEATVPETRLALETVQVLPTLLGRDGTRRYLVLFTSPAESRFLGGFVGSYAELVATDGSVELVRSGPISELSETDNRNDRVLTGLDDYQARYGRLRPTRFIQNVTASPFLDDVAEAARQLYPQAGGSPIDGVIVVDPAGLAGMLALTGPVEVPGLDVALRADNVEELLLVDQYLRFDGDEEAQEQVFAEATRATLDALLAGELPGPSAIATALGPAVRGGHLQMEVFEPEEGRDLLQRLGLRGALRAEAGEDLLAVRTSNVNGNKIDVFLERTADADVTVDPATGTVTTVLRLRLENQAPASGLPREVIGNVVGDPEGTNRVYLSVFTPLTLTGATIDTAPAPIEPQTERGFRVYSTQLVLPPAGGAELELTLTGTIAPGSDYLLRLVPQAAASPERWAVRISPGGDATVVEAIGADVVDGTAVWEDELVEPTVVGARFSGG
jgi:hypothetical protein